MVTHAGGQCGAATVKDVLLMKFLRKAAIFLSDSHNRRALLWKVRRVMVVATALVETLLRDTIEDILPAAG